MLALDNLDNKILGLIGKQGLHPSEISRKIGALRTTIQYRLKRFERSGFAVKRSEGRKTVWSAVFRREHNKSRFRVYKGKDIIHAYGQLLSLPVGTTILSVQGSQAARGEFISLPPLFIKEAHRVFKRKNIILKGMTNEKALSVFKGLDESLIQSHIGRTLGVRLFRDNHFLGTGEIMSTEKFLLLSNPIVGQAVVVKDGGIASVVYDVLDLVFEILDGRNTFDLNDYLRTKIAAV